MARSDNILLAKRDKTVLETSGVPLTGGPPMLMSKASIINEDPSS